MAQRVETWMPGAVLAALLCLASLCLAGCPGTLEGYEQPLDGGADDTTTINPPADGGPTPSAGNDATIDTLPPEVARCVAPTDGSPKCGDESCCDIAECAESVTCWCRNGAPPMSDDAIARCIDAGPSARRQLMAVSSTNGQTAGSTPRNGIFLPAGDYEIRVASGAWSDRTRVANSWGTLVTLAHRTCGSLVETTVGLPKGSPNGPTAETAGRDNKVFLRLDAAAADPNLYLFIRDGDSALFDNAGAVTLEFWNCGAQP